MAFSVPSFIHSSIDQNQLGALPLWSYDGKIIFLGDRASAKNAVKNLLDEDCLGFDTETRPAFRKGQHYIPALVQVSVGSKVFIFQLQSCGGIGPLLPLLEAEKPLKIGLGILDDARHLGEWEKFTPRGFVELTELTQSLGVSDRSLRKLTGIFLGVRISKKEQTSNWALAKLSDSQLRYAATDAWVSEHIYRLALKLREKGITAEPTAEKFFKKNS